MTFCFQVSKTDLSRTFFEEEAPSEPGAGEIEVQIQKYAFSANNVTYAHLGSHFKYWEFFPAKDPGRGIIPVWGFAKVIRSLNPDIAEGEILYGYFPMQTRCVLRPGKVRAEGFADTSPHRAKLPAAYQIYNIQKNDPMHAAAYADHELIFRPLFVTSYLLEDFLFEKSYFGARQLIVTSASSKTAIALAHLFRKRREKEKFDVQCVALTSKSNTDFVRSPGIYDSILSYDDLKMLPAVAGHTADFAGNQSLLEKIKDAIGANWSGATLVGVVQWEENAEAEAKLGQIFFAPAQIKKRAREWGMDGFQKALAESFQQFLPTAGWLRVETIEGRDAMQQMYLDTLRGKLAPSTGIIVNPGSF